MVESRWGMRWKGYAEDGMIVIGRGSVVRCEGKGRRMEEEGDDRDGEGLHGGKLKGGRGA